MTHLFNQPHHQHRSRLKTAKLNGQDIDISRLGPKAREVIAAVQAAQPLDPDTIPWAEGVRIGRECIKKVENICWELGELAGRIEPKYGDQTLERLANELEVSHSTLKNYRSVYRAFPQKDRQQSFSVCQTFVGQKDRLDLVQRKTPWTLAEARALVDQRRQQKLLKNITSNNNDQVDDEQQNLNGDDSDTEPESHFSPTGSKEGDWELFAMHLFGEGIAATASWDRLYPGWRNFKKSSALVKLANDFLKEAKEIVKAMNELTAHVEERSNKQKAAQVDPWREFEEAAKRGEPTYFESSCGADRSIQLNDVEQTSFYALRQEDGSYKRISGHKTDLKTGERIAFKVLKDGSHQETRRFPKEEDENEN